MYKTHLSYVKPDLMMADLILENPSLLLLLEYFEINSELSDKSILQLCKENQINLPVFLSFCNLYNGFYPNREEVELTRFDVLTIIRFLLQTHRFYLQEKYPEIQSLIQSLHQQQVSDDVIMIERFFDCYFEEVREHLNYEEKIAFPYFRYLKTHNEKDNRPDFSVNEYREHHSDIETKLSDLKNLLLKHISLEGSYAIKRKILNNLIELEQDLYIHSIIEELILLPLVEELEKAQR